MTDNAAARRFELLELMAAEPDGLGLTEIAERLGADERTIRRDVEALQELLPAVGQLQLFRGKVQAVPALAGELAARGEPAAASKAKRALGQAAARHIPDGSAVVLTAGTTTLAVAQELRRAQVAGTHPTGLIVFTNSLPALLELVAGGVSTGVLGEVYNPADKAFHSHELTTRFQASLAVVGASGVVLDPGNSCVSLCSDRMEEAAFMRLLLAAVPEILVVAEAAKIGRRHPWSFTSNGLLVGKHVHILTTSLNQRQKEGLAAVADAAVRTGWTLSYEEVGECAE